MTSEWMGTAFLRQQEEVDQVSLPSMTGGMGLPSTHLPVVLASPVWVSDDGVIFV